jgi:hypothetical protein
MKPKLKNFFTLEPSCKALGSAKKCALGKSPSFSKKATVVFEKIGLIAGAANPVATNAVSKLLGKHLAKSYVKHKGKVPTSVDVKNVVVDIIRKYMKFPGPKAKHPFKERAQTLNKLWKYDDSKKIT